MPGVIGLAVVLALVGALARRALARRALDKRRMDRREAEWLVTGPCWKRRA